MSLHEILWFWNINVHLSIRGPVGWLTTPFKVKVILLTFQDQLSAFALFSVRPVLKTQFPKSLEYTAFIIATKPQERSVLFFMPVYFSPLCKSTVLSGILFTDQHSNKGNSFHHIYWVLIVRRDCRFVSGMLKLLFSVNKMCCNTVQCI